jgi:hypothetical protein
MIFALLLSGMFQTVPEPAPVPVEVAVDGVSRCGLGRPTTREDKVLHETVLVLRPGRAQDEDLVCVDGAAGRYMVELPKPLQRRFDAIRFTRLLGQWKDDARQWFAARGMLARFPEYRRGEEVAFTHAVEQLCGPDAAGAFQVSDGLASLNPIWMERQVRAPSGSEGPQCVFRAIALSDLPVGFIGNEAAQP